MKKLIAAFFLVCVGAAFGQNTVQNTLFGAGWNNIAPNTTPTQPSPWCPEDSAGNKAPITIFRLWDDGVKWSQVETSAASPTDNTGYTFTKIDWAMGTSVATKTGCNMDMLYQFGGTPGFAAASGAATTCAAPDTTNSCRPPSDVNGDGTGADAWWLNYAGQIALRYSGKTGSKGHMKYWGIWNEADSSNFWCWNGVACGGGTNPANNPNVASLKNLVLMAWDMLKVTRCIDSTTRVTSPDGHVGTMPNWFHNYVITTINAPARSITITPPPGSAYAPITCSWGAQTITGAQTFDIVDEHMRGTNTTNNDPTSVITAYNAAVAEMTTDGLLAYPLWNDEWGYTQHQGTPVPNVATAASFVSDSLVLMASFSNPNIQRQMFYLWDANLFPLSSTIGGLGYDVVAGWVTGATVNNSSHTGTVYSVPGSLSTGGSFKIMFDSSKTCTGSTISTCATANQSAGSFTHYTDIAGVVHTVSGGNVPVGFAPILMTGATAAATPTCSVTGGTFTTAQNPTCSSTSGGATLCYNFTGNPATNGGTGCAAGSTKYTGAISIAINETLFIVAGGTGFTDSGIQSYAFQFQGAAPTFSPVAGSYPSTQTVTISQAQSLAMCFTTDNSTPTSNGNGVCSHGSLVSGTVSVASSETLKAIGMAAGWTDSNVGAASYVIASATQAAAPTCTPSGGTFATAQSPTCSTTSGGAIMCWTLDGSTPITNGVSACTHGTLYAGAISVPVNSSLMIVAGGTGFLDSLVSSFAFTYHGSAPTFSPVAGTYVGSQSVTLTDPQSLAMCYTVDGSTPTSNGLGACSNGTLYSGAIAVSASLTIKAVGIKNGWNDSGPGVAAYTISGGVMAAQPTFSPVPGAFATSQSVTLSSTSVGAIICYTTDGTTVPDTDGVAGCTAGTLYSSPLTVNANQTIMAVAGGAGFTDSTVASGTYSFQGSAPTFSPPAGTYSGAQTVSLSNTQSYSMCYTTNGSTPTSNGSGTCSNGTLYTVPLVIAATTTLKAISMHSGYTDSAVGTALFTINYNLTVSIIGLGTVNSAPTGINACTSIGGTCSSLFTQGTVVTLTATPSSGFAFAGWSGGGCSGTNTCVVTTNSSTTVTATFTVIVPQISAGQLNGLVF